MSASSLYTSSLVKGGIRLLYVEPNEQDQTLQCTLVQSTLETSSPYHALSYVWGNATDREQIVCNGQPVEITKNLHSVLYEYRRRARSMPIWVDALCINQSNNEERACQVRMMQTIYKQAEEVIIWLGDAHANDELAIDGLKGMYVPWANYMGLPLFKVPDLAAYDMWLALTMREQTVVAMGAFLQRSWFSRMWIVQEVLSAASITVWCGCLTLDPDMVLTGAAAVRKMHNMGTRLQLTTDNQSGPSRLNLTCAGNLETLRQLTQQGIDFGMWELLLLTRNFQSTEPRDKIFALVGLAHDIDETFVDYSLDARSVTINLSKLFLSNQAQSPNHPLDLLSCITRLPSDDLASMPSWAVDWKNMSESLFTPLLFGYPLQDMGQESPSTLYLTDDEILYVEGMIVDQMEHAVKSPAPIQQLISAKELSDFRNSSQIRDWHLRCRELIAQLPDYPTGESNYDAFWRTLMCNRKEIGTLDPPTNDAPYQAWLRLVNAQVGVMTRESRTDLIHRIGSATIMGLSTIFAVTFLRRHLRWKWASLLAILPINFVSQTIWNTGIERYKFRTKSDYFKQHTVDQAQQREFEVSFSQWSQGRKFCITTRGYMGWVPTLTESSDRLVLLRGYRIPFAMRPWGNGWKILGDCYLHGAMEGALTDPEIAASMLKVY